MPTVTAPSPMMMEKHGQKLMWMGNKKVYTPSAGLGKAWIPIAPHNKGGFFGFPPPHRNGTGNRMAIVKPIFTAAAYNDAFYSFYGISDYPDTKILSQMPSADHREIGTVMLSNPKLTHYLTAKIPGPMDPFITITGIVDKKTGATKKMVYNAPENNKQRVAEFLPLLKRVAAKTGGTATVVDDIFIDAMPSGTALRQMFDILVIGHQEYVTQKEYSNFKDFVMAGGTLVALDGNIFYGEVAYDKMTNTVRFVKGHAFNFDWTTQVATYGCEFQERWFTETASWLGSNYVQGVWTVDSVTMKPVYRGILYYYNPFPVTNGEQQILRNFDGTNIIIDYGAVLATRSDPPVHLDPPPIVFYLCGSHDFAPNFNNVVATYQRPVGQGQVIVFGQFADWGVNDPGVIGFLDALLMHTAVANPVKTPYMAPNMGMPMMMPVAGQRPHGGTTTHEPGLYVGPGSPGGMTMMTTTMPTPSGTSLDLSSITQWGVPLIVGGAVMVIVVLLLRK